MRGREPGGPFDAVSTSCRRRPSRAICGFSRCRLSGRRGTLTSHEAPPPGAREGGAPPGPTNHTAEPSSVRPFSGREVLRLGLAVAALALVPEIALGCPSCFAATDRGVLRTYLFSGIVLSSLPVALIALLGWKVRRWLNVREEATAALSWSTESRDHSDQ